MFSFSIYLYMVQSSRLPPGLHFIFPYNAALIDKIRFKTFFFFFFGLFAISWAAPVAYAGSQAKGGIGAVATGLYHSHSRAGSEPRLRPTPQFTATPDP